MPPEISNFRYGNASAADEQLRLLLGKILRRPRSSITVSVRRNGEIRARTELKPDTGTREFIRDIVVSVIAKEWHTVKEIKERTRLTLRQIRGVLYAADLRRDPNDPRSSEICRKQEHGRQHFRLECVGRAEVTGP